MNDPEMAEVTRIVESGELLGMQDYFPCFCEIGPIERPQTFIFMKQPNDSFEELKKSIRRFIRIDSFSTDRGSLLSLKIEFVTYPYLRELVGLIGELRNCRLGTPFVTLPESKIRESILDAGSPTDRKTILQLENQERWLLVVAPSNLRTFHSFEINEGQNGRLRSCRLEADANISRIHPTMLQFNSVRDMFLNNALPLRSVLFETWSTFDKSGRLIVTNTGDFEHFVLDRVSTLCDFPLENLF
jgi:hypothetical protein